MAGTMLRKESAACVDAEISILMQREAENDRAQDGTGHPGLGSGGEGKLPGQTYWEARENCSVAEIYERMTVCTPPH